MDNYTKDEMSMCISGATVARMIMNGEIELKIPPQELVEKMIAIEDKGPGSAAFRTGMKLVYDSFME